METVKRNIHHLVYDSRYYMIFYPLQLVMEVYSLLQVVDQHNPYMTHADLICDLLYPLCVQEVLAVYRKCGCTY